MGITNIRYGLEDKIGRFRGELEAKRAEVKQIENGVTHLSQLHTEIRAGSPTPTWHGAGGWCSKWGTTQTGNSLRTAWTGRRPSKHLLLVDQPGRASQRSPAMKVRVPRWPNGAAAFTGYLAVYPLPQITPNAFLP